MTKRDPYVVIWIGATTGSLQSEQVNSENAALRCVELLRTEDEIPADMVRVVRGELANIVIVTRTVIERAKLTRKARTKKSKPGSRGVPGVSVSTRRSSCRDRR